MAKDRYLGPVLRFSIRPRKNIKYVYSFFDKIFEDLEKLL